MVDQTRNRNYSAEPEASNEEQAAVETASVPPPTPAVPDLNALLEAIKVMAAAQVAQTTAQAETNRQLAVIAAQRSPAPATSTTTHDSSTPFSTTPNMAPASLESATNGACSTTSTGVSSSTMNGSRAAVDVRATLSSQAATFPYSCNRALAGLMPSGIATHQITATTTSFTTTTAMPAAFTFSAPSSAYSNLAAQVPPPQHNTAPPALPSRPAPRGGAITRFNGGDTRLQAGAWLAVFETVYKGVDPEEKTRDLASYLAGDALDWYAHEVADQDADWPTVRQRFLSRFGTACIDPGVLLMERRKRRSESVQAYALEMNRLMRQTGVKDSSAIAILTNGLPPHYRSHLLASKPRDFDTWLAAALVAEHDERRSARGGRHGSFSMTGAKLKPPKSAQKGDTTPPPFPCLYCEERGIQNAMHWHRDCPYKNQPRPANRGARNQQNNRGRGRGQRGRGRRQEELNVAQDENAGLEDTLNLSGGLQDQ